MTHNSSRNSSNNPMKDVFEKQKGMGKSHYSIVDKHKGETSKSKGKGMKKKKKTKRESLNAYPIENLKIGLIQASKFSTFEILNRSKEKEMRIEELEDKGIAVRE